MNAAGPPKRRLPTGRTNPRQQIRLLQHMAELGGPELNPVGQAELSRGTGLSKATAGEAVAFLEDLGFARRGRGRYAATTRGKSFAELWDRDSTRARMLLNRALREHWSTREAARHLGQGPLEQEELAGKLRARLPGSRLRGIYLVEWLVIGLVVTRDRRLRVSLGGTSEAAGRPDGEGDPAEEAPMGLTTREIQELPHAQYTAFLGGVVQTLAALDTGT